MGGYQGGGIEGAMRLLQEEKKPEQIVADAEKGGKRLPGYGHKIYKKEDPRVTTLYKTAGNLKFPKKYFDKAYAIEKELQKATGKDLPLNVDGAMAAILLELGFDASMGKAFFILGRMPGMMAHIEEETKKEKPYGGMEEREGGERGGEEG